MELSNLSVAAFQVPFHGKDYMCSATDTSIAECHNIRIVDNCVQRQDEVAISCQPGTNLVGKFGNCLVCFIES